MARLGKLFLALIVAQKVTFAFIVGTGDTDSGVKRLGVASHVVASLFLLCERFLLFLMLGRLFLRLFLTLAEFQIFLCQRFLWAGCRRFYRVGDNGALLLGVGGRWFVGKYRLAVCVFPLEDLGCCRGGESDRHTRDE